MIKFSNRDIICLNKAYCGNDVKENVITADDLRICLINNGDTNWEINGKIHFIKKGDIVFLSNRQKRRFVKFNDNGCDISIIIISRKALFNTKHLSFFLQYIKSEEGIIKGNETLYNILLEAAVELESKESFDLINAKFTEFFVKAERMLKAGNMKPFKVDKSMINVLEYIDAHITDEISLKKASQLAHLTESTFSRYFAKCNGIGFKRYVMIKKIEYAIELLNTTDLSVIDVAYSCGFSSISGFYETFRKITGTTPHKMPDFL